MGFFDYILSLSVKGSVLIAVVTAIRFFIKRYPKKYSYTLWCVVFFSLAVQITLPAYFENPFNVPQQTVTETYESITESYSGQVEFHHAGTAEYAQAVSQGVVPVQTQTENYVITAKDTLEQPKTIGEIVLPKLHIVWMVGVVVLLVVYLKNVVDIISLLKFSVCCKNNIYYNEYIKTPFTFGLLNPKIYLPADMDKSQERYVLSHEYAHISRLDHIVKPLCLMITILHWFNPLVWLAFGLMTKDMELSCDEKVIKSYEGQEKKDYCTALLNFALKDKPYKMSAVLFGESNCGQRIKNVLNFKQPKKIAVAVIVAVIAVVAVSTVATEADENIENNPQDKNETIYSTDSKPEFVPDYDVNSYDGLPAVTEDGIPVDEIKTYPGHIAVVPQEDVFVWPLNTSSGTSISCGFSDKFPEHDGVDIAGPLGTEIYAAADGVVVEAEYTTVGDGVYIVIEHSNGMKTLYAHCSELKAKAGDIVTAGQLIALMGSTGNSTGSHLHFEITDKNGVAVDPYRYW